jgi:hypothetical protein
MSLSLNLFILSDKHYYLHYLRIMNGVDLQPERPDPELVPVWNSGWTPLKKPGSRL